MTINHLEKDDAITVELLLDMFLLKAFISNCDYSMFIDEIITVAYEISSKIKTLQYSTSIQKIELRSNIEEAIENTNVNVGGGYIQQTGEQFLVRGLGLLKNISV